MSAPALAVYRQLRLQRVQFQHAGSKLVVEAPEGTLTPEIRQLLSAIKPQIISRLDQETHLLSLSLSEFAAQDLAIELAVPWLEETLWWVPRPEHLAELARAGIRRGRVFTADELTNLTSVLYGTPEPRADLEGIARLKVSMDATIVDVLDDEPARPGPTSPVCRACGSRRFWRSIYGVVVCAGCHPPAAPDLVAEWMGAPGHTRG